MSDFQQALLMGGGIAALVLLTQVGRRVLDRRSLVRPLAVVGGVGYGYLSGAPTGHSELWLYGAGVGLGLVFAALATLFTGMERDAVTHKVMTVCGTGFVVTWVVALAARLVFVWEAEHNTGFRTQLGTFMYDHQIHEAAVAPFFVFWALTMVIGRVGANVVRAAHLPETLPVAEPVAV